MKCFNHASVDAVSICKNCNKALCSECAVDTGHGIACKGECEADVMLLNMFFQQSKKSFLHGGKTYYQISIWAVLFGLALIISSRFLAKPGFVLFIGVLFLIGAAYYFWLAELTNSLLPAHRDAETRVDVPHVDCPRSIVPSSTAQPDPHPEKQAEKKRGLSSVCKR
jgi:hypothetical protein